MLLASAEKMARRAGIMDALALAADSIGLARHDLPNRG
jgi:hypothetical protein